MKNFEEIGKRFFKFMNYKTLGVNKIAEILDFSGSQVSNIKNGKVFGADKLFKILNTFPDLSAEWLLLGEGEMLKSPVKAEDPTQQVAEPQAVYTKTPPVHWEGQVAFLQSKIEDLQRENQHLQGWLKDKDKVIKALEEKESRRIQELEEEIARLTQENRAIKSQPQDRAVG